MRRMNVYLSITRHPQRFMSQTPLSQIGVPHPLGLRTLQIEVLVHTPDLQTIGEASLV